MSTQFTTEEAGLAKALFSQGESIRSIARQMGYSREIVSRLLHSVGIDPSRGYCPLSEEQITAAIQRYKAEGNYQSLAKDFGVGSLTMKRILESKGVVLRIAHHGSEMGDKIKALYETSGLQVAAICESLGITHKVFARFVKNLGLERKVDLKRKKQISGQRMIDKMIAKWGEEKGREVYAGFAAKHSANSTGVGNPMYGKPSPAGSGNGWKGWYREFYFRSFRELTFLIQAERDGVTWTAGERTSIPYAFEGAERTYRPDFIIGTRMIELKPGRLIKSPAVQAKAEAARAYCAANGLTYEIFDPGIDSDLIQHAYEAGLVQFVGDYEQRFLDYISPAS